ncbi:MAG TPA: peptide ABC transporter substrate-binding protein [Verrucomicrobiales bacterium]|nr:peptide ABC transporter substrate-binding protein [Verrucomicrobiales bacterium]
MLFTACSKRETRVEIGNREQILHLGNLSEPTDLDPHVVTSQQNFYIISSLFEGLTGHNPKDASPMPALAERWDISEDGTAYTFHLRPQAKWSNGDPVTAHDFVRTYRRILSPGVASEYSYLHFVVKNAEAYANGEVEEFSQVGYEAVDDHTLRFTLRAPTPYFLGMLNHHSWYPLHLPTIEKFGGTDRRGSDWTRVGNFVGNGPFKLKEWKVNQVITVEKSDTYWDKDAVRLQEINFYPIESADTEERAFRSGQLHVTSSIPTSKIDTYRAENPELLQIHPFFATYFLRFNVKVKPLDDPRVRRALNLTIDREGIIKTILRSGQIPAFNLTPPNIPGYTAKPAFTNDVELARQLLAEAGYPEGRGFPGLEYLFNTNDAHKQIAEALQQMWKRHLGIDITLVNQEAKVYQATMVAGDYQIARYAWVGDYLDPSSFLDMMTTTSGNNQTGWSNAEYDRLIMESGRERDPVRRAELFQQAETILLTELPIAPIYFYTRNNLRLPSVKGWQPNLLDIHPYKFLWLEE